MVGFEIRKWKTSCKMELNQTTSQEAFHENCTATSESKAKQTQSTVEMPILQRGDLSALGTGEETDQRPTSANSASVSVQVHELSAHIP